MFTSENAISVTVFKGKPFSFNLSNLGLEIQKFALNLDGFRKGFLLEKMIIIFSLTVKFPMCSITYSDASNNIARMNTTNAIVIL